MSFESEFKKASQLVINASEQAVRGVALEMFGEIVKATPVDSGRLRGNWQATVSAPATATLEQTDKTGLATIADITGTVVKYDLGQSLFLTNNLPYAQTIEYGHSQQAPAGMVRVTVRKFNQVLEEQARKNSL